MTPEASEALDRVRRFDGGEVAAYTDVPAFGYPGGYVTDLRTLLRAAYPSNRTALVTPGGLEYHKFTVTVNGRWEAWRAERFSEERKFGLRIVMATDGHTTALRIDRFGQTTVVREYGRPITYGDLATLLDAMGFPPQET